MIAQTDVDVKANEITQVRPLLDDIGIAGALVTADALHVQRETARYLVEEKKADCLFTAVKENQPGPFAALDALAWADAPVAQVMEDKGHGRHETRTIQVLPAPDDCFPYAAQAVLVERLVRDPRDGRLRSAVAAPGITSRAAEQGGTPEALALAVRAHRDIEALHHVRDVTMKKDASAPLRHVTAGHGSRPEHCHRRAPPRRLHRHRRRATLGRTEPGQAIGGLESHITRMTRALSAS